jgi:hypothetical protein
VAGCNTYLLGAIARWPDATVTVRLTVGLNGRSTVCSGRALSLALESDRVILPALSRAAGSAGGSNAMTHD